MPSLSPQSGPVQTWPRGKLIADIVWGFALIGVSVNVLLIVLDLLWPDFSPEGPSVLARSITIALALVVGSVAVAIRSDKLALASFLALLNAAILIGSIAFITVRNMVTGDSLSGPEGALIFGLGSIWAMAWWLASREIRAEMARRT